MSASRLIRKAAAEGISVKLESDNKLKACGPAEARAKWLPILREHKSELLAELAELESNSPRPPRPPLRQGGEGRRTYDGASPLSRDQRAIVTVPAGADPFATAAQLIRMARARATPGRSYRFRLVDQREADRRNAEAARNHSTDRYCACGALARCQWLTDGRPTWTCDECAPTMGRA